MREITQNYILKQTILHTNPLAKSLQFYDCKIEPNFFKEFTVAFEYLEELSIRNMQGLTKNNLKFLNKNVGFKYQN